MALREEFEQIAVEIFDAFENVVLTGTYVQRDITYVPGGTTVIDDTDYPIRLIREDVEDLATFEGTGVNTNDVDTNKAVFLSPQIELPVAPDTKDLIRFDGVLYTIITLGLDPADSLITFNCQKQ